MKQYRLVTAESVRAGHPDKFCDQIADSILDAYLRKDPHARVAVEAMITDGKLLIAGEVTSAAKVKITKLVTRLMRRIATAREICARTRTIRWSWRFVCMSSRRTSRMLSVRKAALVPVTRASW